MLPFQGSYNFTKFLTVKDMQVLNAHEADIVHITVYDGQLVGASPLAEAGVLLPDAGSNLLPACQLLKVE